MSASSDCGCCEGISVLTPVVISNLPGLSSISYRVGIQPMFKESMITSLNQYPALVSLTTRSDDDLIIDLFDAWAMVADVLTFYQERIANEGYLRTAKERLSVLQLARSIGYELSPGVAASGYLAFTLDTTGSVQQTTINVGTKVMSVPLQGQTPPEMPQTFETIESIVAYPQFNSVQPMLARPQMQADIDSTNHVYLSGTSTKLNPGDKLLLLSNSGGSWAPSELRSVLTVTPSASLQQTDVELVPEAITFADWTAKTVYPVWEISKYSAYLKGTLLKFDPSHLSLTPVDVNDLSLADVQNIISTYPTQTELVAYLTQQGWDYGDFAALVNSYSQALDTSSSDVQVYALRVKTGIFGNTAPAYSSLPASETTASVIATTTSGSSSSGQTVLTVTSTAGFAVGATVTINAGGSGAESAVIASVQPSVSLTMTANLANAHSGGQIVSSVSPPPFGNNWDNPSSPWPVTDSSQGPYDSTGSTIYLSGSYPAVAQGSWLVLTSRSDTAAYTVEDVWDISLADFMISAKVTGLELDLGSSVPLSDFTMRGTTVYGQSEELTLIELPDTTPVEGASIGLSSMVAGLEVGQALAVTGQLSLQSNQTTSETVSEIVTVFDVTPYQPGSPFTTITLQPPGLANSYERSTFSINANVALATHGSTVNGEILGSGDPSQDYLDFTLKSNPLTFIPSTTSTTGTQSTLQVWISNGGTNLLWNQAPSLYNLAPDSQSYAVRIEDDGSVDVLFGAARPPVGVENITATYRVGIGSSGMLAANQLTILASRPLGLKTVTNPLATTGAADPEEISDARQNAPLQVLTMGRIVSLEDCQNFASAYQGIGKALAVAAWQGENQFIRLIVASAMQGQVDGLLLSGLQSTIANFSDPLIVVNVESFTQLTFNIGGWIIPASDQDPDVVQQNVLTALQTKYSFASMQFGQPVYLSDVISTIQNVDGVVACDVTSLYVYPPGPAAANNALACDVNELLILNPDSEGVSLSVNTPS